MRIRDLIEGDRAGGKTATSGPVFRRYGNPEALAHLFGPCPRGRCDAAMVTASVWSAPALEGGVFRLTCDSEACIADAVRLVMSGDGV